jgi:flagellar L-ring protein precursor FlgH
MPISRTIGVAFMALLVVVLAGCQSAAPIRSPAYAPIRPAIAPRQTYSNGAIYQQGVAMRLFEDSRARRVGDILTISLAENTTATKANSTSTAKDSSVSFSNPTLLGTSALFNLPSGLPLASTLNNTLEVEQSGTQSFDGQGSSNQSNSLTGNLSVTVVEVLPNGAMIVRGEKLLSLNRGDEFIRLTGMVRPEDISADNTVASTRVADVSITYSGRGEVADASSHGWLSRFFLSVLWPF